MDSKTTIHRKLHTVEIEVLQAVLIAGLPHAPISEVTTRAVECAKAVKAAFEELCSATSEAD